MELHEHLYPDDEEIKEFEEYTYREFARKLAQYVFLPDGYFAKNIELGKELRRQAEELGLLETEIKRDGAPMSTAMIAASEESSNG